MRLFAKQRPSAAATPLGTLIAEDVEVTGDLCFAGAIRIDGRIKGNLVGQSLLVISAKGHVEGNISCNDAVVDGTVVGDLAIANFLELQSNSKVCGAIRYGQLLMDQGASVSGQLSKTEPVDTSEAVAKPAEEPPSQT